MAKRQQKSSIPTKAVRIEVFDIQGHNGDSPLDYQAFFNFISEQVSADRRESIAERIIAVPSFVKTGNRYSFVAYAGSSDTSFLVLDLNDDSEEIRHIEDGKIIATRTIGVIDASTRRAAVQYVHTGVRAAQIATLFEKLATNRGPEFEGATLEFAPVPGRTFAQEVAAMERIQSASLTLTRPNVDWDDFANAANGFAADSGAHNIGISASAPRSGTLSKQKGIVHEIVALTTRTGKSIIKAAAVVGFREGESALTTLNLSKHIEAKNIAVPLGRDGLPSAASIREASTALLDAAPVENQ